MVVDGLAQGSAQRGALPLKHVAIRLFLGTQLLLSYILVDGQEKITRKDGP